MVFRWNLSDSKSPQVSRTLLSILAVLNNVVVWMVAARPPTSKSSSPLNNPLVTVSNAPITIGIIFTCMFHSFFQFPIKVEVLILLFTFFQFYSVFSRDSWLIIIRSGLLAEIRWSVCISKSHRSLCVLFSRTCARFGIYHLLVASNLISCTLDRVVTYTVPSTASAYSDFVLRKKWILRFEPVVWHGYLYYILRFRWLAFLRSDSKPDSFHSWTLEQPQTFRQVHIETTVNMEEHRANKNILIALTKLVYLPRYHDLNSA